MKNIKGVFKNLEKKLTQSSWYEDGWNIYNRGVYLQLYKDSWHNYNQGGVHFETFIETNEIRKKAFPICLHAEEDCPSQSRFIEQFLALEGDRISSWKGYKTVGTGYTICIRTMPLNFKNLEQRLYEEFCRLRKLESGIQQALDLVEQ